MALIVASAVHETSTTTGTGNLTLAGAENARQAFSDVCANGDTFYYAVYHRTADEFEHGYGSFVSATPAISRDRVDESSNGDALVNFSAGTKDVILIAPALAYGFGVLRVTPSANQNDYAPSGLKYCNVLEINPSVSMKLTGLAGGSQGRRLAIRNVSTDYLVWLENENTASSAANRFTLPQGFPAFLLPGDTLELIYNDISDRWEVLSPYRNMGLTLFSDMGSHASAGNNSAAGGLTVIINGSGASTQPSTYLIDTTERPLGVVQLDTGSTSTGRASLGMSGTGSIIPALGPALSVSRLAVETTVNATDNFQIFTGFIDSADGSPADGAAWNNRWNGSAAEWSQDRWASGSATRSVTNSPTPDNNYIWLVVFLNADWTRADFIYSTDSMNFVLADSPTTGLPDNTRPTGWQAVSIIKNAGTTQRNVSIDLAGYRYDHVRG